MRQILKIALLISFIGCLYINYISNAWPLNGFTAGQLSDLYPNQFTPAGFTFSVWGVIYLSALAAVVTLLLATEKTARDNWYYLFIALNILNGSWLLAWHFQYMLLSVFIMVTMLIVLIIFYVTLRSYGVNSQSQNACSIMTSFYLSWISVALIANTTALLVNNDILTGNLITEFIIAAVMLLIAFGICSWLTTKYTDYLHPLILAWAAFGVFSKAKSIPQSGNEIIIYTALAVIILSLLTAVTNGRKKLMNL